jgi:hypothetical protein
MPAHKHRELYFLSRALVPKRETWNGIPDFDEMWDRGLDYTFSWLFYHGISFKSVYNLGPVSVTPLQCSKYISNIIHSFKVSYLK